MEQSGLVGAWDGGPFDNDEAADFAQELDDADPSQRLVLLRTALQAVLDDSADLLDDEAAPPRAVAAAAVLAGTRVPTSDESGYGPKFLATDDPLPVTDDLVEAALLALDTIADSDTEWAELYAESGTLDALRDALTA
jgi:hypothetical protein